MLRAAVKSALLVSISVCSACSKHSATQQAASANAAPAATPGPQALPPPVDPASITANYWPSGYWLGFDGKTSFSMLLAGGRGNATYTVADPSIASIEAVSITIDQGLHDTLWSSCTAINPQANQQMFDKRYGVDTKITAWKLTALKPGQTYLTQAVKSGGGFNGGFGGGGGRGGPRVIFVTEYPANAVEVGKARYNDAPAVTTATNVPCGPACHGHAAHGAPNHALGQVETLPDVAVSQWMQKGDLPYVSLNAQNDKGIAHAWTFASKEEELGTIAYLRTLQSTNFEELLTLEFQGDTQVANICKMTQPPGVGGPGMPPQTGG